jgi:putative transposase
LRRQAAANEGAVKPAHSRGGRVNDWPHAPVHRLSERGAYLITAGTYRKIHHFNSPERLALLRNLLLQTALEYEWKLQAWAVMANHYHFLALAPENPLSMKRMLPKIHTLSAREINRLDATPGRKVWHNFWDSKITIETSYFARLNYVNQNPVRHGACSLADEYEWCSAKWFAMNAPSAFRKTISTFSIEGVNVLDDF